MTQIVNPRVLDVDEERGFLPRPDPPRHLPAAFARWEDTAALLPKLLAAGRARQALERLPVLDPSRLPVPQLRRAMLLLSFFAHGYVWQPGEGGPADRIPAGVAIPWQKAAERLGRPPVLSYASYALDNWRRLDPDGPIALGNLGLLQNFLGGMDEEWFVLVHVEIEALAAPALAAIPKVQKAVIDADGPGVRAGLETIAASLDRMHAALLRMPERCDPYIYYHRVRPYIHGFARHPVIYEGVAAYQGEPQRFLGETGAQSTIIPSLDAVLGIEHAEDALRAYLDRMREYMPPGHRAFLQGVERGPSVREFVGRGELELVSAYDACVSGIERFRGKHLEYAAAYILRQAEASPDNPVDYGTGGTPFVTYLGKHRDETARHRLG